MSWNASRRAFTACAILAVVLAVGLRTTPASARAPYLPNAAQASAAAGIDQAFSSPEVDRLGECRIRD